MFLAVFDGKKLRLLYWVSGIAQYHGRFSYLQKQQRREKMKKKNRGFTLIELLVVVLIIGILAAVAVQKYRVTVIKSRFTELYITARSLLEAQKIYHLENDSYADTFEGLDILPHGTLSENKKSISGKTIYCARASNFEFHCKSKALGKNREDLSVIVDYRARKIYCRATTDIMKQVCRSFGGVTEYNGATYNNYLLYKEQ